MTASSQAPSGEGLIERLELATEGSRELDVAIYRAASGGDTKYLLFEGDHGWDGHDQDFNKGPGRPLYFTASLDAALTLITPPHWLQHLGHNLAGWNCRVEQQGISEGAKGAPTPALALCIAALKARQASQGQKP